jgi:NADH:ubiquinone oxidoreductase subunit
VGHDEFGNAYYRSKGGKIDPALGFERRSEASMTPPGWTPSPAGLLAN